MNDLFNNNDNTGQSSPDMLMREGSGSTDLSRYRYRVERFSLGGSQEEDEASAMEALLTRSIQTGREVVILDRKDSISATTGIYTCIIIYLEALPN